MRGNTIHDILSVHALGVEENILVGPGKLKKPTTATTEECINVTKTRSDPITYFTGVKTKAAITLTGNSATAIAEGGRLEASFSGGFNLTSTDYGLRGATLLATHGGSGTVALAVGGLSLVQNISAGTITTGFCHITASGDNSGGGTFTNLIGHAVANQSLGTNNTILMVGSLTPQSGNYAIYSASTYASVFSGAVTVNAIVTVNSPNLLTTTTKAVAIQNVTASDAVNTIQYSPGLDFIGHSWNSLFSADRTARFRIENRPTAGAGPTAVLTFLSSVDTGAESYTSRATLTSAGTFTVANLVGSTGITNSSLTSGRVVYSSTAGLEVDSANMTFNGNQFGLAATGSSGGILVGGDVQLYRVSADVWYTPDTLQIVPANFTLASADGYAILATATGAPSGSTGRRVFGLSFTAVASTNNNYTDSTGGMTGLQAATSHTGSGTITAAACGIFSGSSGSTGTITTFNQIYCLGWDVSSGSTVTTWNGVRSDTPRASGSGTVTTAYAFVCHPRTMSSTITNIYGLGIFPSGNMNAHSHASETRVGIAIGGMPDPGANATPTTIAIWISSNTNPTTARDGIYWGSSKDTNLYRSAASTLKTDSAMTIAGAAVLSSTLAVTGNSTLSGTVAAGKALTEAVVTLTDAATIAVDASLGNIFRVTLGGNRTLGNPTNSVNGQKIIFEIIQDGTGSRTLAFGTDYAFSADITSITVSTGANKHDFIGAIYNSTLAKWCILAKNLGFN